MTRNQIEYLKVLDARRHNARVATETERANRAQEVTARSKVYADLFGTLSGQRESARHNRAVEEETRRANVAREFETQRSNLAKESETHRSNVAHEALTSRGQDIQSAIGLGNIQLGYSQVGLGYSQLGELNRHNVATELEINRANVAREGETRRSNIAREIETATHNRAQEDLTGKGHAINLWGTLIRGAIDRERNDIQRGKVVSDALYRGIEIIPKFIDSFMPG